jgi:HlyD family secretion protein
MPVIEYSLPKVADPQDKYIELRTEEVQELLGQVPHWMVRWGISLILGIICMLLVASWLIKYPDVLTSRVMITTKIPPVNMVARSEGQIQFYVKNSQLTGKGEYLAVIENPATTTDVWYVAEQVKEMLPCLSQTDLQPMTELALRENLSLGELQGYYLSLLTSLQEYKRNRVLSLYRKQIQSTQLRIAQHEQLNGQLEIQQQLLAEELQLAQKRYTIDAQLLQEKVIAEADFDRTKNTFLQAKRAFESAQSGIINNQILISQLQAQLTEYHTSQITSEEKLRNSVETALKQLQSQLDAWEQKFVLKAPIEGEVAFTKYWSDNQFVKVGEEVLTIVPPVNELYAQVHIPISGSGKVEVGQRVTIKFDNYPSHEFGMVRGTVQAISPVPQDNLYAIRIALPQGLTTHYRKNLPFRQQMQGTAEIITKDLRLIERIFNQFRALVDQAST